MNLSSCNFTKDESHSITSLYSFACVVFYHQVCMSMSLWLVLLEHILQHVFLKCRPLCIFKSKILKISIKTMLMCQSHIDSFHAQCHINAQFLPHPPFCLSVKLNFLSKIGKILFCLNHSLYSRKVLQFQPFSYF